MKRKILLSLFVLTALFIIIGCSKENGEDNLIKITDNKNKGYVTTFKSINNKFVKPNPKFNHVDNEELGIFITLDYIESSKEAYDYAKTHNFLGREYAKGEVKDYKWNNYDGYFYSISENEMYFRILLEDDKDNSIVLSGFIGPKVSSDNKNVDLREFVDNNDLQKFFNSIEFKKENNKR